VRLISELKRRNVFRMAVLYVVAAWLVMQVAGALIDLRVLPESLGPWVMAVLVIGFPIALVVSWFFDMTPEGVVREAEVPEDQPVLAAGGRRTDFVIIAILAAAIILMLVWEPPASTDEALTVLPFESMTGPDEASFAEGVSIELQNFMAQLRKFKVKQPPEASILAHFSDIPTLAREMDVRWVLKGSVRHAENRVRIAVQLIDADDEAAIAWSNVFDRELSAANLFGIQTEIARAITSELRFSLDKPAEKPLAAPPTQNTEAYNAYLVGRQRLTDRRVDWLEDAIEQFAYAIDLDPDFGRAYSGLVDACLLFTSYSGGHKHKSCPIDEADLLPLARKAVRLAPDSGEAWVTLGASIDLFGDRQSKSDKELSAEAEDAFKRGLSLNPSNSQGYLWYSQFLYGTKYGRQMEAWLKAWRDGVWWKVIEQGLEVDPLSLQLHRQARFPDWVHSREEALWHMRRIVEIAPDSPQGYGALGYFLWRNHGRADEMVRLSSKAARLDPRRPDYPMYIGFAYMALGDYEMALAYFHLWEKIEYTDTDTERGRVAGEAFALLYAGRTREAIEKLEALQDTPWLGRPQLHGPLNALAGIDLRDGHPERALSRFREHRPECFADVEFKDLSDSCPMLALARILQEVGDEERVQEFVLGYTPELQESWDNFWSHLDYRIEAFVFSRYEVIAGRHEQALTMLEDLVEKGFRGSVTSEWDWRFFAYYDITLDPIRDHPRFRAIIAVIEADMAQQLENVREMQRRGEVPTLEEVNALIASARESG
jgi:TolB-like protein